MDVSTLLRRSGVIACVIYQILFSIAGGIMIFTEWLTALEEKGLFLNSCLKECVLIFALCFPFVCGIVVLQAFDKKLKSSITEKNGSSKKTTAKQKIVRLCWPGIIKFEEVDRDEG
jgi:hypothetical protein